jgi:hypothetical protein
MSDRPSAEKRCSKGQAAALEMKKTEQKTKENQVALLFAEAFLFCRLEEALLAK